MMKKEAQISLLDFLQDSIPELQNFTLLVKKTPSSDANVQKLYGIWSDVGNKVADRKFLRPPTMTESDIMKLESSGLVEIHGRYLKVTSKGADAIKGMILHSEKSSFTKSSFSRGIIKTAQQKTQTANNWYGQQKSIEQDKENMETNQDEPTQNISD